MSVALQLASTGLRWTVKPLFRHVRSVALARLGMVAASLAFPFPFGVTARRGSFGGIDGLLLSGTDDAADRTVLLWFHGGAYVTGSAFTHRGLLGRIARAARCDVVLPNYRLAPEHPAPAAFDDACAAFDGLVAAGWPAHRIVLGGDSAGGGIALALLARIEAAGARVAGIVLLSPWTDLTLSGASVQRNARPDPLIPADRIPEIIEMIRGNLAADDPRLSPVLGPLEGSCPALILVGSTEVLLDDSRRVADRMRVAGATVDLQCRPDAPHVLAFLAPWVPEARADIRRIAGFVTGLSAPR